MSSITTISRPKMPPKKEPTMARSFCALQQAAFLEPLEITENEFDDSMKRRLKAILEGVNAIVADAKTAAEKICQMLNNNNQITNKAIATFVTKELFRLIRDSKIDDQKTIAYGILLRTIVQKDDRWLNLFEEVKDLYAWTAKGFNITQITINPKDLDEQGHRFALFFSMFNGEDKKYHQIVINFMTTILDQLENLIKEHEQLSELKLNVISGFGKAFYLFFGDYHPKKATPATPKPPVELFKRFIDVFTTFMKCQQNNGSKEKGLLQNIVKAPKTLKISEKRD